MRRAGLLPPSRVGAILIGLMALGTVAWSPAGDRLPSWNDGPSKQAIVAFVGKVTSEGSVDAVPIAERIAVFDNDGTLWSEQPIYFQFAFALDRVKALAPKHPEWKTTEPFQSVLAGNLKAVLAGGEKALMDLMAATHVNNTTEEFEKIVTDWVTTARHTKTKKLYTEMVFQPMLEMLAYLRDNGFKTYIVSGGGVEFMRAWAERVYGVPPEQVVGSRAKMKYDVRAGTPVLLRLPAIDLVDDGPGKPVGIQQQIGRRPILAFGNSDGDFQMLEWTTSGPGVRLGVIVHHTDADREWAYDRASSVGKLVRGLDEAPKRGWIVVDMRQEWKVIYPSQK
jgi:hypothetical protein